MVSFRQYIEKFNFFDSQVSRKGSGPSVTAASHNGILQKPAQVQTAVLRDTTSFSGNNTYFIKSVDIPFKFKIRPGDNKFLIFIRAKNEKKFLPLSSTDFIKYVSGEHDTREEAENCVRELIFRISQLDL